MRYVRASEIEPGIIMPDGRKILSWKITNSAHCPVVFGQRYSDVSIEFDSGKNEYVKLMEKVR